MRLTGPPFDLSGDRLGLRSSATGWASRSWPYGLYNQKMLAPATPTNKLMITVHLRLLLCAIRHLRRAALGYKRLFCLSSGDGPFRWRGAFLKVTSGAILG